MNRLFPQVVTYQFAAAAFIVCLALTYVLHVPKGPTLGLGMIAVHLVLYIFFALASRNATVVDPTFVKQALASTSRVGPIIGYVLLSAIAALVGIILLGDQEPSALAGFTLAMSLLMFGTVLRRAIRVVQLTSA